MSSKRISNGLVAVVAAVSIGGALPAMATAQAPAIPPGARIAVQTADVIDSDGTNLNAEYKASLADPLMSGSVVLVPKGTPALLRVVQLDQAGAVKGRVSLGIRLVALVIDGRRMDVNTGQATIQSDSQGSKTAKSGIIGGILGAAVGLATGGGAGGAAKGAAVGAAAGAGVAAINGVKVNVPRETRLSFTVADPSAPTATADAAPPTLEGFTMQLDNCKRQRTASVTCELTAINQLADRTLFLERAVMVDSAGIEQQAVKMQLGRSKFSEEVAQSPARYHDSIKAKLQFGGVTPDVISLATVRVTFAATGPGGNVRFDAWFKNVPLPAR